MSAGTFQIRPSPQRLALLVIAFAGWLAPLSALAADAPARWLERMNEALIERDYRGEFSYYSDGDLSSLSIVHAVIDGVQNERLVHLNGEPREILRTGDVVHCVYERGDELAGLSESIPSGPFARSFSRASTALSDSYRAEALGTGRVAGRAARRIDILPVDGSRYGYRLWLDEATGMLLRSELLGTDGELLEIFQFVSLEMNASITPEELRPEPSGDQVWKRLAFGEDMPVGDPAARDDARWKIGWLPSGFALTTADVRHMTTGDRSVRTMRYTDGLADFSVFVEQTWSDTSWQQSHRRGATSAVMREVRVADDERWLVTVVGEVPMATAERIAHSVVPATGGSGRGAGDTVESAVDSAVDSAIEAG